MTTAAPTGLDDLRLLAPRRPSPTTSPVRTRRASTVLALADLVVLLAVLGATGGRVGDGEGLATVALVGSWMLLLALHGAFEAPMDVRARAAVRRVLLAAGSLAMVLWGAIATGLVDPTPPGLAGIFGLLVLSSTTTHLLAALVRRPVRVAVAGDHDSLGEVADLLRDQARWRLVGTCPLDEATGEDAGERQLVALAREVGADAVVLTPSPRWSNRRLRRTAWALERVGVDLLLGTGVMDVDPRRAEVVEVGPLSHVHVRHARRDGAAGVVKMLLERTAAAALLVILCPLLLCLMACVRLESPGAAIFRQQRVGRDGSTFTMLKLRTMTTGADRDLARLARHNEAGDGPLFKIRADPRVTRVGRLLRRYSLDELPQLVNVLRGQMSLVGPRPALPQEVSRYDYDAGRRLAVRPGLTGLWQVSGRSDLSWDESVRLDLSYVDNWSLGLDLAILARTVRAVVGHRGAY